MSSRQTANSHVEVWLHASPRGTRTGFVVLPDGVGGAVTVTVLPKPWSLDTRVLRSYEHVSGSTSHVVLFETESACIRSDAAASLIVSIADIMAKYPNLLALGTPPEGRVVCGPHNVDSFRDLIDLMLLADRASIGLDGSVYSGNLAPSLLRLLMQERFINEVETLIFRARPRYKEHTELLSVPRGRLREKSLLHSIATGIPQVECTFDELTMDTDLLQVIASALGVVASEQLPRKVANLRPTVKSRANLLLRHLRSVTAIEREKALILAGRIWLGPLDKAWQPALDSALPVLNESAVAPEGEDVTGESVVVQISMEKLWEQCLEGALQAAFAEVATNRDYAPHDDVTVPSPWGVEASASEDSEFNEAYPDFMFVSGAKIVLADAKYKMISNLKSPPGSQDGYQLFSYSHLAKLGGRVSEFAVLLYPARSLTEPDQAKLLRRMDRSYPLWRVTLPFPTRSDIRNQSHWNAYLARLANTLRAFSVEWHGELSSNIVRAA